MRPETEAFLAHVRDAELPPSEVEWRVLEAVRKTVAAPGAPAASAAAVPKLTLKLAVWIAGVAAMSVAIEPASEPSLAGSSREIQARTPAARGEAIEVARVSEPASAAPVPIVEARSATSPSERAVPQRAQLRTREPSNLQAELALLAEVHAALRRGDGAGALQRLDGHRTTDRQLAVERRAARIFALCAAGRTQEAQLEAVAFVQRHPGAPQRWAVQRACSAISRE